MYLINGKVAGSHEIFPFKNPPNFTGIPLNQNIWVFCLSHLKISVLANFSMLFLPLVWYCLSCIPYFLHKAGQVVQGLVELIPFSPDFSNLPTCYSYSLTNEISNYRIYFPIRRRRKTFARIIKVAPVDAEYWVTEDTFALVPGSTAEEKNVSKILPLLWFTSLNGIKPLPFPKSL